MKKVQKFYVKTPFNQHRSLKREVETLSSKDPFELVPILRQVPFTEESMVLEVGSGTGWLLNGLALFHTIPGLGLDLNPRAVKFSNKISKKLGLHNRFIQGDLFDFRLYSQFDVIISYGALHHTKDCHEAIRHLSSLLKPGGHIVLGLYHISRRPFLEHFDKLKMRYGKRRLKKEFFKFRYGSYTTDKTVLKSIFYDQVFHPHETQHSLPEIMEVLESSNCKLVSTSINQFKPFTDGEDWNYLEKVLINKAKWDRANKIMNFGFFTVLAKKQD